MIFDELHYLAENTVSTVHISPVNTAPTPQPQSPKKVEDKIAVKSPPTDLNEDIMGLDSIVNAIEHPLEKKKETIHGLSKYFDSEKKGPRTQKWGTGQQRLHQNMVPDMHKHDPTLIQKVEILKLKPAGSGLRHVVSLTQLKDIMSQYSLKNLSKDTTRDKPKHLGSTGIMIYWDRDKQSYCIEK